MALAEQRALGGGLGSAGRSGVRRASLVPGRGARSPPRRSHAEAPSRRCRRAIDRVLDRARVRARALGVEVRDLQLRARALRAQRGQELKPASTLKLVTTAAVLDALGARRAGCARPWRPRAASTRIGRVLGDVYLVGRGDRTSQAASRRAATAAFEEIGERAAGRGRPPHRGTPRRPRGPVHRRAPRRGLVVGGPRAGGTAPRCRRSPSTTTARTSRWPRGERAGDPVAHRPRACVGVLPRGLGRHHVARRARPPTCTLTRAPGTARDPPDGHLPDRRRAVGELRRARGPRALRGHRVRRGAGRARHRGGRRGGDVVASRCRVARARAGRRTTSPPLLEILKALNKTSQNLARRDDAAPAGRAAPQAWARAEAGHEAVGEVPAPRSAWSLRLVPAGRIRPLAVRRGHASRDGEPARDDGPPSAARRPFATRCPSPGATAP